jgi:hypothetical protein
MVHRGFQSSSYTHIVLFRMIVTVQQIATTSSFTLSSFHGGYGICRTWTLNYKFLPISL